MSDMQEKKGKKMIKNVNQNDIYKLKMAARTLFVYEILKYEYFNLPFLIQRE